MFRLKQQKEELSTDSYVEFPVALAYIRTRKAAKRSPLSVWFLLFAAGAAVGLISLLAMGAIFAMFISRPVPSKTALLPEASVRANVPDTAANSPTVIPEQRPVTPTPPPLQRTSHQKTGQIAPGGEPSGAVAEEPRPPAYVSPQPLKQALPDVSLLAPGEIEGPLRVEVRVKINESGRVTDALLINGSKISENLTNALLNAAKRWSFAPAKRDGKPVVGEHTIVFQFGGPAPK